ncbi:hypothetical protein [Bacillus toyonensis]|uniref:hypothetical protein n=1 Tax=Bacillus toyonensis TaxID=155322 RepID=UPI002E1EDC38|nr:hypothetical protein [Bacillus toyonensis]
MKKLFAAFQTNQKLQKAVALLIIIASLFIPENIPHIDYYYAFLFFLFIYITTYAHIEPIWKGLSFSLIVSVVIIGTFLLLTTFIPEINEWVSVVIATFVGISVRHLL